MQETEVNVWCVIIRTSNGSQFLASNNEGAAVYFDRKHSFECSKALRELGFKARVEKGKVMIDFKDTITVNLPPTQRKKRGN